jgi:hypothetical protein
LFSLPDANVIVPDRNYTALVDLEREDAASMNAPAAKGAETATTGAAKKGWYLNKLRASRMQNDRRDES